MDPCMELNPVHKTLFKSAAAVFPRQRFYRYCVPAKRELGGSRSVRGLKGCILAQQSHIQLLIVPAIVPLNPAHGSWQKWSGDAEIGELLAIQVVRSPR